MKQSNLSKKLKAGKGDEKMSEPFKRRIDFTNADEDVIAEIVLERGDPFNGAQIAITPGELYVNIDKPGEVNVALWLRLYGTETPPFFYPYPIENAKKATPREILDWYNKTIQDYFKKVLAEFEKEELEDERRR